MNKEIPDYVIRESAIMISFRIFVLSVVFNVIIIILITAVDYFEILNNYKAASVFEFDTITAIIAIIIFTLSAIWMFLDWYNRFWYIDDQGLVFNWGIIFTKRAQFVLKSIDALKVEENFFGKKYGYGDVVIETLDKEPIRVKFVTNPEYLVRVLESRFGEELKRKLAREFIK